MTRAPSPRGYRSLPRSIPETPSRGHLTIAVGHADAPLFLLGNTPGTHPPNGAGMSESRPFPPSPRRRTLARQAGLSGASPLLVGGFACGAVVIAIVFVAKRAADTLGAMIVDACSHPGAANPQIA